MYYVGIDIGSTASEIASRLLDEGIDVMSEGVRVAATGYGRVAVDYADFVITEITCHGRGGRELAGNECAIIDVGGQDTKVILVDQGMIQDFLMNDKCSAGTGKFLEIMANRLGIALDELFELAAQGTALPISSRAEGKGDTCSWGLLYLFSPGDRHGYGGGSCRALFHI